MSRKKRPEPDDKEQAARFIKKAKEIQREDAENAFNEAVDIIIKKKRASKLPGGKYIMVSKQFHCNHDMVNRNVNLTLNEVIKPGFPIAYFLIDCDSRMLCGNNKDVLERKDEYLCPACMYEKKHPGWA
jgi:peptide subunit release factor 1 (eRF1)